MSERALAADGSVTADVKNYSPAKKKLSEKKNTYQVHSLIITSWYDEIIKQI